MQKNEWKNQKFQKDISSFLSAEGARGETSPYKQFFQVSAFWENWKNSACKGTQAVLAMMLYRLFCLH